MPANRYVRHRGAGQFDEGQYETMCEVFGAPGAAPLYRREMLDDVEFRSQYFDESFFTWYEDVDLDWRAKTLGWLCVYAPRAVAYHVGHPEGHSGDCSQITTTIRNRWLMVMANDDFGVLERSTWAKLAYELGLLRYVIANGYVSAYMSACKQFARLAPTALAKRRWTRQRSHYRRRSPVERQRFCG